MKCSFQRDERKEKINAAFSVMDKDNSNSVSIEEIVDYMLLHGRFDLGTKVKVF